MTKLSVNVNKLATLRNSRGKNSPDVVAAARNLLEWGAHGITVHPRPDARHIRRDDVTALSGVVREFNATAKGAAEFNVEGYPSTDYLALINEVRPNQATLVPDPPEALTSNAGWSVAENENFLDQVTREIRNYGVRVSVFVEPKSLTQRDYESLDRIGVDRVELYTEEFADGFGTSRQIEVTETYRLVALRMKELGVGVNAGHDLSQKNLAALVTAIPWLAEVSIGHALICEALEDGLQRTLNSYLRILGWNPSSSRL
jgi:pyridoxine 5-phosphate synthase